MHNNHTLNITPEQAGERADKFLAHTFPQKTRSWFTRFLKSGEISINGKKVKPGYILQAGDVLHIAIEERPTNLQPANIPLNIVFEDDDIIVVNKPAGLTVHPGKGTEGDTLVNALLNYTSHLALSGQSERPGIVHRLDKHTSGLLVVAKNDAAHLGLRRQFDSKTIARTYWSLVWGEPKEEQGTVHTHIDRSKKDPTKMAVTRSGKEAITHWRIKEKYSYVTLLQLNLETGRTHQIRLHMNFIGFPVVGDKDYNGRETQLTRLPSNLKRRGQHLLNMVPQQFLHAKKLTFLHPRTQEQVHFESPLPAHLQQALDKLSDIFLLD